MPSNVFRFDESWEVKDASVDEVYDVLAHGELLPQWWKGVYLDAVKLSETKEPTVGDRLRAPARRRTGSGQEGRGEDGRRLRGPMDGDAVVER